jgi:dihydrofolate reductase
MRPLLSLIAAFGEGRVIGIHNRLPWRFPADLKRFRTITWGKPVLMGRKTFESIGKPLPGRLNLLITRNNHYSPPGCSVVHSFEEAMEICAGYPEMIAIGGASVYEQAVPLARRMYLTLIHHTFPGDRYFPDFCYQAWREIERVDCQPDANNPYHYSFIVLGR